ncbi:AAA family ATPase [Myxococcus sp. CA040A]|uniref:AAA family ATPase n=1 Tax=Myxococcus sp. CA040A TaxID=2741738 RepID=UPI00157A544E|nr:ATP-binding protein [Myxococcus sp. CA040A]NTX03012.1 ATP-binding protein [Myxococcus sp. CA040A]
MSGTISLYNPRSTPPKQLEAMLVGRDALLKELLDNLREQSRSRTRQHWLLRGPRGMGKTHLTGVLHHRVRGDAQLSESYLPLWLGEADVYEVYSPATLLERIAERLVEAVPEAKLAMTLRTLEGVGDEESFFQELASHLGEEAERQGKTLLVMMENLDALLESFAPKEREVQVRQLRSLLLHAPHFLFISTTPTRYMVELTDPKKPLYNQFKERDLRPLSVEEVGVVFSKLVELTGRKGLEVVLGDEQDGVLRRKVIHQLTGGLPRSVVMAFEVMRDKTGIKALVEDLRRLLDAQTAYFEARLSRLAPRERSIVTTMALASSNLTLKEIATRSRLPERTLSTLMARLVQDGHVEYTSGSGGKGSVYGLSEGLFRLWYQYRKGRLLLEPLVRLLAYLFNPSELQDTIAILQRHVEESRPESQDSAHLALRQAEEALRLATSEEGRLDRERLWKECQEEATATREHRQIIERLTAFIFKYKHNKSTLPKELPPIIEETFEAIQRLPIPLASDCIDLLDISLFLLSRSNPTLGLPQQHRLVTFLEHQKTSLRNASPFTHLSLAFIYSETNQTKEAMRHANAALRHEERCKPNPRQLPLEMARWTRAVLFVKLGRIPEAIRDLTSFTESALASRQIPTTFGIQAAHELARLHQGIENWEQAKQALQGVLKLSANVALKERDVALQSSARLRLIISNMALREISPESACAAIEQWSTDYPDHRLNGVAREFSAALTPILRVLTEVDPYRDAKAFLSNPTSFYRYLKPEQLHHLFGEFEKALPPEEAAPLHIHALVVEALDAAIHNTPGARARLNRALGRLPTELRQVVRERITQQQSPAPSPPTKTRRNST